MASQFSIGLTSEAAGARTLENDHFFFSAPQLKRGPLGRDLNTMRFRAKYASASENGDYYWVAFDKRDAASDAADVYPTALIY